MYERRIDLMDECVSIQSAYNHYAREEGVKASQSNREIVDFVVKEISNTLGGNK
jgi:hypothetical protein